LPDLHKINCKQANKTDVYNLNEAFITPQTAKNSNHKPKKKGESKDFEVPKDMIYE
jgi:hypothetical protein